MKENKRPKRLSSPTAFCQGTLVAAWGSSRVRSQSKKPNPGGVRKQGTETTHKENYKELLAFVGLSQGSLTSEFPLCRLSNDFAFVIYLSHSAQGLGLQLVPQICLAIHTT